GGHHGAALQPAGAGGWLVLKQVPAIGLLAQDLSGAGAAEALRSTAVGLRLGHGSSVLSSQFYAVRSVVNRSPGVAPAPAARARPVAPPWRESSRRGAVPAPS